MALGYRVSSRRTVFLVRALLYHLITVYMDATTMGTYSLLNGIFLLLIASICVGLRLWPWQESKKAWGVSLVVLLVLTAVFDSCIIAADIVDYDGAKILGWFIGKAPIEDFAYALGAAVLVPTLWHGMPVLRKLFWISRPISWPNTAYPFAAGYLVAGGGIDIVLAMGILYFLFPYNLLMYGINDVFDYESDIRNPRKGGIEGMREQRKFHPTITMAAIVSNVPFILFFLTQGTVQSKVVLSVVVFFVVAYSIAKLRFKERPVLDSFTSSMHFVGPLLVALSFVGWPEAAWPYVIAFALWGMASHAFGAVQDIIPDRKGKLASIATYFGGAWTVRFSIVLYAAAVLIVILQGPQLLAIGVVGSAYIVNIWPYRAISDTASASTNSAWRRFIWLNFCSGAVVTITLIMLGR